MKENKTEAIDGLGYHIEPHRMAMLFEINLMLENGEPIDKAALAVCTNLKPGMMRDIIEGGEDARAILNEAVAAITNDATRFIDINGASIKSIRALSWEEFLSMTPPGKNPMALPAKSAAIPFDDSGQMFGRN